MGRPLRRRDRPLRPAQRGERAALPPRRAASSCGSAADTPDDDLAALRAAPRRRRRRARSTVSVVETDAELAARIAVDGRRAAARCSTPDRRRAARRRATTPASPSTARRSPTTAGSSCRAGCASRRSRWTRHRHGRVPLRHNDEHERRSPAAAAGRRRCRRSCGGAGALSAAPGPPGGGSRCRRSPRTADDRADGADDALAAAVRLADDQQPGDARRQRRAPVGQRRPLELQPAVLLRARSLERHQGERDDGDEQQAERHDGQRGGPAGAGRRAARRAARRASAGSRPALSTALPPMASRASSVRPPGTSNGSTSWRTATPPASRPSDVRIQARNVRSLASVKR